MREVIIWAEFLGAWLLVIGPLYQGSVELGEMDVDREGLEAAKTSAAQARENQPSPWWWLLPPVMYVLHRRWANDFRQDMMAQLTETQREQLTAFRNKATGWFTVAAGGTLLATGETWQVTEHYDWPVWLFWLVLVVMIVFSLFNTAARRSGDERGRRTARSEPAPVTE